MSKTVIHNIHNIHNIHTPHSAGPQQTSMTLFMLAGGTEQTCLLGILVFRGNQWSRWIRGKQHGSPNTGYSIHLVVVELLG